MFIILAWESLAIGNGIYENWNFCFFLWVWPLRMWPVKRVTRCVNKTRSSVHLCTIGHSPNKKWEKTWWRYLNKKVLDKNFFYKTSVGGVGGHRGRTCSWLAWLALVGNCEYRQHSLMVFMWIQNHHHHLLFIFYILIIYYSSSISSSSSSLSLLSS